MRAILVILCSTLWLTLGCAPLTDVNRQGSLPVNVLDSILAPEAPVAPQSAAVAIMGGSELSPEHITAFVRRRNPDFDPRIAQAFIEVGERYGIRGDIALCQSIVETGWFKFTGGTAVTPDQHNYCGLGVTRLGLRGSSFSTIEEGVTAQIQHLFAYACTLPLPSGETLIDPRFSLVKRGVAPTWDGLNRRWAANDRYSKSILSIFEQMRNFQP